MLPHVAGQQWHLTLGEWGVGIMRLCDFKAAIWILS
jgi:hypothetical protein